MYESILSRIECNRKSIQQERETETEKERERETEETEWVRDTQRQSATEK